MAYFNTTCGGEVIISDYSKVIESYGYNEILMYRVSFDEIEYIDIDYDKASISGYIDIYLKNKSFSHIEEMTLETLDKLINTLDQLRLPKQVHYHEKPNLKFERSIIIDIFELHDGMAEAGIIPNNQSLFKLFEMAENGSYQYINFEDWIEEYDASTLQHKVGKYLKEQLRNEDTVECLIQIWW